MEHVERMKAELSALRPLRSEQIALLFPRWEAENSLFVYESNAIEGSTLTLGETIAVIENGITIGGKPLRDHLDALNGARAFRSMLDLARARGSIDLDVILNLHRAVVGDVAYAGALRDQAVYIRGSRHVPPNYVKVPSLMEALVKSVNDTTTYHPVERAARAHFEMLTIHPFVDGNGRTARLLQNLLLIASGYVPILIPAVERPRYFDVLQQAQTAVPGVGDARDFVAYSVDWEIRETQRYLEVLAPSGD